MCAPPASAPSFPPILLAHTDSPGPARPIPTAAEIDRNGSSRVDQHQQLKPTPPPCSSAHRSTQFRSISSTHALRTIDASAEACAWLLSASIGREFRPAPRGERAAAAEVKPPPIAESTLHMCPSLRLGGLAAVGRSAWRPGLARLFLDGVPNPKPQTAIGTGEGPPAFCPLYFRGQHSTRALRPNWPLAHLAP